jgi:hypothetical protein
MKKNLINITARLCLLIFFAALFVSCNNRSKQKNKQTITPEHKTLQRKFITKPPSSFEDTLTIKVSSAVFYKPDSVQLEKIKAVNKPMVFEGLMHDCFFQMRYSHIVLKKYYPKIKIIETTKARYLLFVKQDGKDTCIDLNHNNDICGMYIFNTIKNPQLVDMTNVDTELEFYFKK